MPQFVGSAVVVLDWQSIQHPFYTNFIRCRTHEHAALVFVPYVRLPKYENYAKIAETALNKAPELSKLRLSNFHNCTSAYLK